MTDRATSPDFEDRLTEELRRHAAVADDARPAEIVAREAMRAPRSIGPTHRLRRWRPLLGLAAMLLLPAAVFTASHGDPPSESPAWEALVVRPTDADAVTRDGSVTVVGVAADGTEHFVREIAHGSIPLATTDDGETGFETTGDAVASADGWLALGVRSWVPNLDRQGAPSGVSSRTGRWHSSWWWALLDLRDPDVPVRLVERDADGAGAWGPDGWFATICPTTDRPPCSDAIYPPASIQVVDASEGTVRMVEGIVFDRFIDPRWAADGSGLLTPIDRLDEAALRRARDTESFGYASDTPGVAWGIDPLDDGPRQLGVPDLYPGPGPRTVTHGGWTIGVLDPPWRVGPMPDGYTRRETSFDADGQSLWLLLQEPLDSPRWVALAHARGHGEIVVLPNAASVARPSAGTGDIAGLAPDDSIVVIGIVDDWTPRGAKVAVVPTDGRATTIHAGRLAGFIPSGTLGP